MNIMQKLEICDTIQQAVMYIVSQTEISDEVYATLVELADKLGENVDQAPPAPTDNIDYFMELYKWAGTVRDKLHSVYALPGCMKKENYIDRKFCDFVQLIKSHSENDIVNVMAENFKKQIYENRKLVSDYAQKYKFWGDIDTDTGRGSMPCERAAIIKNSIDDIIWLYNRMCDYKSRAVLYSILYYWLTYDFQSLDRIKERVFEDYFDFDILNFNSDDVIVDVGAFIGDTAISFVKNYGGCKKMYCYEIDPENAKKAIENTSSLDFVQIVQKAVSDENGEIFLDLNSDQPSNSKISNGGSVKIPAVTLDEDIQEKINFIKMDIEGAEQSALKGCAGHIRKDRSKLAVCTYHGNRDLIEIPKLIDGIRDDYRFYMRYNGGNLFPTEYVLFAL